MTVTATHAPGTFCWADLGTPDPASAKRFYTGLFGWSFEDRPIGDGSFYTMFDVGGKTVAALYPQVKEESAGGIPPHWLSYVSVENADRSAARATELGGTVIAPPMDVMDVGRMALISDPTGAGLAVWEPRRHPGAALLGEPGAMCWNELHTPDTAKAGDFYAGLFDWEREARPIENFVYTVFRRGEQQSGGMMGILPEWGPIPSHWKVYFAVDDCDARAAKVEKLGGRVTSPPADIPGVGRFALIQDPQGATFAILRPNQA